MAENTDIDISKIEKRLHNLINQFGIKIEESHTGTWTNNPDMLQFSFWHDKSADILKQLKFQFVILMLSQDNIFKFNKNYCLAFDVMTSKTKQFRDYLNQLDIPTNLNEILPVSEPDEFLRDFSNDEILAIVNYYPEKVREFMINEYRKLFKEKAGDRLDECTRHNSYYEPLRYFIWSQFISSGSWHLYLEEISYGHSEDWAQLVAAGKPNRTLDDRYRGAFRTLRHSNWNSAIRNLRLNIRRRFGKESDLFADKYFDLITGWSSHPLADTQSYMSTYNTCISEGRSHTFADIFAQGMTSGYRTGDVNYWKEKAEKVILKISE